MYLATDSEKPSRVGELDEEMVYESRPGDVIALGATSWRITEITHDRVLVIPAPGQPARLPFWRGDQSGRPPELGEAIGRFTGELAGLDHAAFDKRCADIGFDEFAIAKTARSAEYIALQAVNQGVADRLVSFGADEGGGGGGGHFAVIVQSVTVDAWVVIGLCMIMAIYSWYVMWSKGQQLGRVTRGNAVFLDLFSKAAGDFDGLRERLANGEGKKARGAPLTDLFATGSGKAHPAPPWDAAHPEGQLYDMEADPGETDNLWDREPAVVAARHADDARAGADTPVQRRRGGQRRQVLRHEVGAGNTRAGLWRTSFEGLGEKPRRCAPDLRRRERQQIECGHATGQRVGHAGQRVRAVAAVLDRHR